MKRYKGALTLLALAYCSFVNGQGRLEIIIENIKEVRGEMRIGLFGNADAFPKAATDGKIVKVTAGKVLVVFDNLENGEYAISIFHDRNANGELDTNFVGIPKEGFAFGNNAMGAFGPPSFDKAKVKIDNNTVLQQIELRHF